MVAVVDEGQTRAYIKTLNGFVENGLQALESARRWPWKHGEVTRLLYETAHNLVVVGINHCAIGETEQGRACFLRGAQFSIDRLNALKHVYLGYHDLQVISAAAVADAWHDAEMAAVRALTVSGIEHENQVVNGANAGVRAVFGWLGRSSGGIKADREIARESGLEQFALWAEIAWCAAERDELGCQTAFDSLVALVGREVRSGDFRYSEDRFAYLPGQLLLLLARRDDIALTVPNDRQWRVCGAL